MNDAIQFDPMHANAYQLKGECLFELKDYQGSVDAFTKAIEIDPMLESISFNLSVAKVNSQFFFFVFKTIHSFNSKYFFFKAKLKKH